MAQRVLEPGQIESLAQRSIPRVRQPDYRKTFKRRAERLRKLAPASPIDGYLAMLARLADSQAEAAELVVESLPSAAHLQRSREHGLPPLQAQSSPLPFDWHLTLKRMCAPLAADVGLPRSVGEILARITSEASAWREAQAEALLGPQRHSELDLGAAPFIMAALQVHFVKAAGRISADLVQPLDAYGVCPLCGSLPVVSVVYANTPYQGYRYLHCGLCAMEWHMVRVQCTACGAVGKDIAYHTLEGLSTADEAFAGATLPAVRAETCEHCRGYRKILYEEQDTDIEPLADDLGTLALDLLLSEQSYHRASNNPLLWTPAAR